MQAGAPPCQPFSKHEPPSKIHVPLPSKIHVQPRFTYPYCVCQARNTRLGYLPPRFPTTLVSGLTTSVRHSSAPGVVAVNPNATHTCATACSAEKHAQTSTRLFSAAWHRGHMGAACSKKFHAEQWKASCCLCFVRSQFYNFTCDPSTADLRARHLRQDLPYTIQRI